MTRIVKRNPKNALWDTFNDVFNPQRQPLDTVLFRRLEVRFIVQESPIDQRVEGSFLYRCPLSINSAKFSFSRNGTEII